MVPSFRKLDRAEIQPSVPRPHSERARVAQEYDVLLEEFTVGDHGRAELAVGEQRVTVRQRLQAAARRRGLALRFRPGRGPLIFRVDVVAPRPPEVIPAPAAEPPGQANGLTAVQRAPEQRRPRKERRPAGGRYDAMLPRWMREGSQSQRRGASKRRER